LLNLGIGILLALVVKWHFNRFGSTLSNREEFAQVFPFVMLTTLLIITIVKSSLALSLGLVGALSIVRFRTPIKEPEELAYLFVSIGIGLGLGANQAIPTVVASLIILAVMAALKMKKAGHENKNLFLSIDFQGEEYERTEDFLNKINNIITKHVSSSDLRRFDVRSHSVEITYLLDIRSVVELSDLTNELQREFPSAGVSFIDQNRLPSI
jgi:uncharacterized membrane protein YhiD involved in acid resistance